MKRDAVPAVTDRDAAIDDERLVTIIEQEIAQSIGHWDGSLASDRKLEMDYYLGKAYGNEMEGESQVVSTDVADTIEGILPIILNIFCGSDDVVRFDPNGPEDEEQAKQQTETANYVFYRQNNGFLVMYEWFKDALIQKNGVVKYWWEEKEDRVKETYEGLTDAEYRGLMQNDSYIEIEELEHTQQDDPQALAKLAQVRAQLEQMAQNPQAAAQASAMLAELEASKIPQIHDVTVRIVKDASKICVKAIPPEEFGISARHNCVSIQDAPFCYHRAKQTISSLRSQGCPEEIISGLSASNEMDTSPEAMARDRFTDNTWRDDRSSDDSMTEVWVTESFIRLDVDGDGIAELRHVMMADRSVWVNEETDHINFAALTPVIMPHRWTGRSVAELVMDIQFQKSVLWRQMFNNLYLTNNPQKAVLSSAGGIVQANLDDLLTSRAGGILREYAPNAIRHVETPFVAGASFPMLEYMDGVKENRTGVTRYNQGTDADSLNKTARGISLIQSAGQQRTNLIARIFAETGVKDLMRGIVYMLSRYSSKAMTVKLRNKWVDVDPREWKTQYNMTVNVGLGTGNKDVQLAHLGKIAELQMMMMKEGRPYMVTDENIYNVSKRMSEAMGFKHPELFFADPKSVPPEAKKPPPSPEMMKIQAEDGQAKAKLQMEGQKEQFRAQTEQTLEQIRQEGTKAVALINGQTQKEIAQMKIQADAQLTVFDKTNSLDGEKKQLAFERTTAEQQLAGQVQSEAVALDAKARDLDVREEAIRHAEEVLGLKANMEKMAEAHREELTKQSEQKVDQRTDVREKKVLTAVQSVLGQVADEMANVGKLLKESVEVQKRTLDAVSKPKRIAIEDVKVDASGKVTGATVTPQTLQ